MKFYRFLVLAFLLTASTAFSQNIDTTRGYIGYLDQLGTIGVQAIAYDLDGTTQDTTLPVDISFMDNINVPSAGDTLRDQVDSLIFSYSVRDSSGAFSGDTVLVKVIQYLDVEHKGTVLATITCIGKGVQAINPMTWASRDFSGIYLTMANNNAGKNDRQFYIQIKKRNLDPDVDQEALRARIEQKGLFRARAR